jgi:hypothetical protein
MLRVEWTVEIGLREDQRDVTSFLLDFIEGEQVIWGHIPLLFFGLMIHVKLMIKNLTLLTVNWHQLLAFGAQLFTPLAFHRSLHKHFSSYFWSTLHGLLLSPRSITCATWPLGPSLLSWVARCTFPRRPCCFLSWLLALSHSIRVGPSLPSRYWGFRHSFWLSFLV